MNYFELFDLPVAPTIDTSMLSRKYFELQKKYHPDFFSAAEEEEKEQMLQQSAAVNKGYKIFQDPDQTLAYFLQTTGYILPDEKYSLPPDFLMEMMEINETLTDNPEGAAQTIAMFDQKLKTEAAPLLNAYTPTNVDKKDMETLKSYYYRRKYLKRILDRLTD